MLLAVPWICQTYSCLRIFALPVPTCGPLFSRFSCFLVLHFIQVSAQMSPRMRPSLTIPSKIAPPCPSQRSSFYAICSTYQYLILYFIFICLVCSPLIECTKAGTLSWWHCVLRAWNIVWHVKGTKSLSNTDSHTSSCICIKRFRQEQCRKKCVITKYFRRKQYKRKQTSMYLLSSLRNKTL